jgi:nicotinate-nucleotide--dimethylbenzimidazole phosphoribosyltransferase
VTWLADELTRLRTGDVSSADLVRARAAEILRPTGALARLDEVAAWVAQWQRTAQPSVSRPAAIIFAADHGVASAGVSNYPTDVTAAMLAAYRAGKSTISAFASIAGATVEAIDVGVGRPTGDIRVEPAMSADRLESVCATARDAVDRVDTDLLVLGEMGIGNTTSAAAVVAALQGGDVTTWVGRGTGVDDAGLARKVQAVEAAVQRVHGRADPLELLRELGGCELVAIAAAIVAARQRSLPVLLDGYVVTASALPLHVARAGALDHCMVAHCSAEPGHRRLLQALDQQPLLDLSMRLGEGSGAMAAVPLVAMACAGVTDVPTFGEWFG